MTGTPYIYDAGTTTPLQAPSVQNAAPKSCAFYFISDASYATLYLPYDVTTTGSTKAYYIGTTNNGYAQLTETGSEGTEIPANTAVVLVNSDADASTILNRANDLTPVAAESENLLKGTLVPMTLDLSDATNYYSLGRKNGDIGFYKLTGGTITLGANKAYLETPAPGGAVKGFVLGFNDLVGVDKIHSGEAKDAVLFNLAGQRVAQPSQRGVYIVGGKKVVVK